MHTFSGTVDNCDCHNLVLTLASTLTLHTFSDTLTYSRQLCYIAATLSFIPDRLPCPDHLLSCCTPFPLPLLLFLLLFSPCFALVFLLLSISATILEVGLACLALSLLVLLLISRYARATADNYTYQLWSNRFITTASAALVVGILAQLVLSGMTPPATTAEVALAKFTASFKGNTPDCLSNISQGTGARLARMTGARLAQSDKG